MKLTGSLGESATINRGRYPQAVGPSGNDVEPIIKVTCEYFTGMSDFANCRWWTAYRRRGGAFLKVVRQVRSLGMEVPQWSPGRGVLGGRSPKNIKQFL